jgi:8-oxo-dGTP pyrophosphatase MutT (NUDIX family)
MSDIPEARPASTVVLLRDSSNCLETLMLRRNKALIFAGGAWVFPGGALEPGDLEAARGDVDKASKIAASREASEESGLSPAIEDMVLLSHWTTPVGEPKRFSTWIYAAPVAGDSEVVIDGSEIHDSRWLPVHQAVAEHEAGELNMLPPTYFTLVSLSRYDSVAAMVAVERHTAVPEVFPVFSVDGDDLMVMFRGDAGYESTDGSVPGARHRAVLQDKRWRYYYQDVDAAFPPLIAAASV